MSNKKTNLSVIIILILAAGFFSTISPMTVTNDEKIDKKNISNFSTPKSSASTVLSLQNYTFSSLINDVEISGDGKYIVASSDNNLALFNKSSSKPMWNITTHSGHYIQDIAISFNGTYIAVGTDYELMLFNNTYSTSKTPMWNYTIFGAAVSVEISDDGVYIVASDNSPSVYFFNNTYSTSKTYMWHYTAGLAHFPSVAISFNGTYIAAGSWDYCVYLFNYTYSTSKTAMWKYNTTNQVKSVDISFDGTYIAVAHGTNISYIDSTQKLRLWKYDHLAGYPVHSVDMSADGGYLVSRADNSFKITTDTSGFFDSSIQSPKRSLWGYACQDYSPKISADGYYAVTGDYQNVSLLDKTSSTFKKYTWSYEMEGIARNLAISANSSHVAAACSDNKVYLLYWDVPEHYIPRILASSSDDDDNDDEEPVQIPFGDYYLFFVAIAVFSLIAIMRRKVIFKTK